MEPPVSTNHGATVINAAIVQTKPRKGRYDENLADLASAFEQLGGMDPVPDLVVLPEAALTGYFLEGAVYELARSSAEIARDLAGAWKKANGSKAVDVVCGFYENCEGTYHNSSLYLRIEGRSHEIVHVHRKMFLPTYGVFDEERFLSRGRRLQTFDTRFGRAAMLICEDVWHAIMPTIAAIKGARFLIVPSAAPGRGIEEDDELGSIARWREILQTTAAEHGVFIIYAGLAGFEGGKGMTGNSCVVDPHGRTVVRAPALGAHVIRARLDMREIDLARAALPLLGDLNAVLPDLLLDDELPLPYRDYQRHPEVSSHPEVSCHPEVSRGPEESKGKT
ncbi:MAG TPA: nitrilase-related carbon-nitrogen hydrolase [Candidatus Baltobacteraceae bacterium]|nr:nitrilase-related carbon-nitrogen hydrolase [Candidatus Baltobacteraceae bacterium]